MRLYFISSKVNERILNLEFETHTGRGFVRGHTFLAGLPYLTFCSDRLRYSQPGNNKDGSTVEPTPKTTSAQRSPLCKDHLPTKTCLGDDLISISDYK